MKEFILVLMVYCCNLLGHKFLNNYVDNYLKGDEQLIFTIHTYFIHFVIAFVKYGAKNDDFGLFPFIYRRYRLPI